ncbi:hypothetical protein M8C22_06325 [Bacillus spizizenii]|uniref:hypothetical protein n=1 Tax=Bacillus spizizenii TaxID=96241 RepID=UPI0009A32F58|nr:hypothetical protein [Bacillus spizizenii]OPG90618.1 hypothetical protein B2I22_15285 [Bacillus spizizenii]
MSKLDVMIQSYTQAEKIRESVKGFVMEAKQGFEKRETEILRDATLTRAGQEQHLEKARSHYLKQLLGQLQSAKKEFEKSSDSAVAFADEILLADPERPSAAVEAEFERRLTALRTDTILATNTKSGLSKLDSFVNAIDNPYFARKMMDEFPALAASFVNKDVSSQLKLGHINTKLISMASTEEQKQAQQIKESALSKKEQPLIPEYDQYYNVATKTFGPQMADYLRNPESYSGQE